MFYFRSPDVEIRHEVRPPILVEFFDRGGFGGDKGCRRQIKRLALAGSGFSDRHEIKVPSCPSFTAIAESNAGTERCGDEADHRSRGQWLVLGGRDACDRSAERRAGAGGGGS